MQLQKLTTYAGLYVGILGYGFAESPTLNPLDAPITVTRETLHLISRKDFEDHYGRFAENRPKHALVAICVEAGWVPAYTIFVCKNDLQIPNIVIVTEADTNQTTAAPMSVVQVGCEPELIRKIVSLVRLELKRARRPDANDRRVRAIDGSDFYFCSFGESDSGLFGESTASVQGSTVGRLAYVCALLRVLANSEEHERVDLLGKLDRGVTVIEVAYKQAGILPP